MRKLASVKTIGSISPIEGKDRIVLATVDGWQVIVQKDEYKVGDRTVYVEIDSQLPAKPEFAFLEKRKYRIKTLKMAGVVSQGICFPMSILPKGNYELEQDVTDILGITKYEKYVEAPSSNQPKKKRSWIHKQLARSRYTRWLCAGKERRGWPEFVKQTDETRCLDANTYILTSLGRKRIGEIVNNKMECDVLSYNTSTGMTEYKPIIDFQKISNEERLLDIEYEFKGCGVRKNRVLCTKDHPFWNGSEYVSANLLRIGDYVFQPAKAYSKDILPYALGMVVGDCHVNNDQRCPNNMKLRMHFTQGDAQKAYLEHKLSIFDGGKQSKLRQAKSGYCDNSIWQVHLHIDPTISNALLDLCYVDGKVHITQMLLNEMTPISLAYWYMDDGSITYREDPSKYIVRLHSCRYSEEENKLISDWLTARWGIKNRVCKDKTYFSIHINDKEKFLELITPHIPHCMRYKTAKHLESISYIPTPQFSAEDRIVPTKITNITYSTKRPHWVYDITVADNHNFFANNVLTHNCQNIPSVFNNKDIKYVVREKIEGQSGSFALKRKRGWFRDSFEFIVCSRTIRRWEDDGSSYWPIAKKFNSEDVLHALIKDYDHIVLQGECVGPGIQGNIYKLDDYDFYAFNLFTPDGIVPCAAAEPILAALGIKWCPKIMDNYTLPDTVNEMLEIATGRSLLYPTLREGLVLRNYEHNISFKAVSPEYLLKND